MKTIYRLFLIAVFLLAAVALFFVNSDREFVSFPPLEGEPAGVILRSDTAYQQTLTIDRHSISRLSLFLRPVTDQPLPADVLEITVSSPHAILTKKIIPVSFLNRDGVTQINFTPALATEPGDPITFVLLIPPKLSGLLRAQTIDLANDPDLSDISFMAAAAAQPTPLAFQLYYNKAEKLAELAVRQRPP